MTNPLFPTIYPPAGVYELTLTNGRKITRPMEPNWVWDDHWDGAYIKEARNEKGELVWSR